MNKINNFFVSEKFKEKILLISNIFLIVFFLGPIFAMLTYLIVNKYTDGYVSTYSLAPADVFYYITCFVGAFGILILIANCYSSIIKKEKPIYFKFFILIAFFIFWILICDFMSKDKFVSFFGAVYREEGFFTIIAYIGIASLAYISFKSKEKVVFFFRLITIVSCIISFLILLESFTVYIPFFEYGSHHAFFTGPFYHFNHYGYYLTITLMVNIALFHLEEKKYIKYILLGAFALQSYSLILCNTFGCFLAVLFGLICFIVFKWIRYGKTNIMDYSFLAILIVVALIVALTPYPSVFADFLRLTKDVGDIASGKEADHAGSSRWRLWKLALNQIGSHPVFGIGSDMSDAYMFENICTRPHNEFIQYTLFYGIPGGIMYFVILCIILFPCLINIKKISNERFFCFIITLAYLFSSLFGNTTYYITPIFLIFLVGCLSFENNKIENKELETIETKEDNIQNVEQIEVEND